MTLMVLALLAAAALPMPDIADLGWLAGCWEAPGGTQEMWMKPAGGTLFGMSRTVANGKTVFSEFIQIHRRDGEIYYTVQPRLAQKATDFKLVRGSATELVFENPEHDFPQRILYRRQLDGSLFARVEGRQKEKDRAMDIPMKRVSCQ